MNNFFDLTDQQKVTVFEQTASKMGLPTQAIEKDLWVNVILQIVFSLPLADKLVFKGGTSLSKIWNQIDRFSEDIDLAIDRSVFGDEFIGDLTKKQIKKLRKTSSLYVKDQICETLNKAIKTHKLDKMCEVVAQEDGVGDNTYPEPRKIHIRYKSLISEVSSYLSSEVLLEISSRSLIEPTEPKKVSSIISDNFPISTTIADCDIITALPQKTFLEKAFLLHELFSSNNMSSADRKSRHLYDLEKMMDKDFALNAVQDNELWNTISHHREIFTPINSVDYTPDIRDRITLIPPKSVIVNWQKDYEIMQTAMIYGTSLSFINLIKRIEILEKRFKERNVSK